MLSTAKHLVAVCLTSMALIGISEAAWAGYLLEIDTDGADNGVLVFHPGFSFGGDTTTASQSAQSTAFGTTGADSIFGGDGSGLPDTYVYNYAPDTQPDNLVIPAGQALGEGNLGTGVVGGVPSTYNVYATWPFTSNVSGGLTTYQVTTVGDSFTVAIDQNGGGAGRGNAWVLLGTIDYTSGPITVTQAAISNTFISMRAYGLLFEAQAAPLPTVSHWGLIVLGLLLFAAITLLGRPTLSRTGLGKLET